MSNMGIQSVVMRYFFNTTLLSKFEKLFPMNDYFRITKVAWARAPHPEGPPGVLLT